MPTPYNGGQSPLEYYALNGNQNVNGGLGRPALLNKSNLLYGTSFKKTTNEYGQTNTNAKSDLATPYRGKGTNDTFDLSNTYNGYTARNNYIGGDDYDIKGSTASNLGGVSIPGNGIGRNKAILYNITTFGYGVNINTPTDKKNWYTQPDTSKNIGQVVIP